MIKIWIEHFGCALKFRDGWGTFLSDILYKAKEDKKGFVAYNLLTDSELEELKKEYFESLLEKSKANLQEREEMLYDSNILIEMKRIISGEPLDSLRYNLVKLERLANEQSKQREGEG